MNTRTRVLATLLGVVIIAASCQTDVRMWRACTPAFDGNPTGTDGEYVLICRQGYWEPLMTVHEYVGLRAGEDVKIAPLPKAPKNRRLALAFTNVNGTAGFQPTDGDLLIAELRDTNNDQVVSAGDTITTESYPTSLTPPFAAGTFGVQTRKVAVVDPGDVFSDFVTVYDSAGNAYSWIHSLFGDLYSEDLPNGATGAVFLDQLEFGLGDDDFIVVYGDASSQPSVSVNVDSFDPAGRDADFVNVVVSL